LMHACAHTRARVRTHTTPSLWSKTWIPHNVLQNQSVNGHYKNVKFLCADVTSPNMHVPEGSVDVIFSNWLLMYLSDNEVSFVYFRAHIQKFHKFIFNSGLLKSTGCINCGVMAHGSNWQ
jgi:hypothetical protein